MKLVFCSCADIEHTPANASDLILGTVSWNTMKRTGIMTQELEAGPKGAKFLAQGIEQIGGWYCKRLHKKLLGSGKEQSALVTW